MTYVITKDEKDIEQLAAAAWFSVLGDDADAGEDRAWCPGVSPPDNSCPPSNKGSDKSAGGKSAAGSGKKSKSIPPRRPTAREVAIAAREGMAARQIAARKVVAAHFLHNEGKFFDRDTGKLKPLDEGRFKGQMKAIDWTKPVQVGPPPKVPPPKEFVQWQAPGNIPPAGGYFATPGTQPESLGIGRQGTAWSRQGQPVMRKVPHRFEVKGSRKYIQSTAARADDNWSIKGGRVQRASGGGQQWFVPDAQAGGGIDEFVFRGPSRSDRAFCPGVSPPDNSCSPANKGARPPRPPSPTAEYSREAAQKYTRAASAWLKQNGVTVDIGPAVSSPVNAIEAAVEGVQAMKSAGLKPPEEVVIGVPERLSSAGEYDCQTDTILISAYLDPAQTKRAFENGWLAGNASRPLAALLVHEDTHREHFRILGSSEEAFDRLSGYHDMERLRQEAERAGRPFRPAAGSIQEYAWSPDYRSNTQSASPRPSSREAVAIAAKVSEYAKTDPLEFVAEVRAGMAVGNKYPEDVMRLYEDYSGPPVGRGKR
jgi:hypothetical protein